MPDPDKKLGTNETDEETGVIPPVIPPVTPVTDPDQTPKPVVEPKPEPTPEPVPIPAPLIEPVPDPSPAPLRQVVATSSSASYFDLLRAVVIDPDLTGDQKQIMLKQLQSSSPTSDRLTYRLAISLIGIIAMLSIVVIWHLLAKTTPTNVPDGLIAIASGAVGGLAGLLSPSRSGDSSN